MGLNANVGVSSEREPTGIDWYLTVVRSGSLITASELPPKMILLARNKTLAIMSMTEKL
jgi:hypothetical protein